MEITFCEKKTFVSIYFYIKQVNLIMKACYWFFLLFLTCFFFPLSAHTSCSEFSHCYQMDMKQASKCIRASKAECIWKEHIGYF